MEMNREDYINNLKEGHIIAYKNDKGMFTGKIIEVRSDDVVIQTINNSVYTIKKEDITWVKLGSRWPTGIFNALVNSKGDHNG